MEQNERIKKYKCDDIPVIAFNTENEDWEAYNTEIELSHLAAIYKNQLDEAESRKAANSSALHRSVAMGGRRHGHGAERNERRGSTFPKGFSRFGLIIIVLLAIWVWTTVR